VLAAVLIRPQDFVASHRPPSPEAGPAATGA